MNPKITVIMSVYNEEKYLHDSIDSILNQTFTDFEFLIINDGSTDNTVNIINSYQDVRIRLIHNLTNIGLTKSLNKGLALAQGTYIARMDADDISHPMRLDRQINFMDTNNDVGLCGTWLQTIEEKKTIWKPPIEDNIIRASMIFENVIYHPTAIFRRDLLRMNKICYDESLSCAQDYAFWLKCSTYTKLANIDEVLLYHRIHSESIGATQKNQQQKVASQIRFFQLKKIGLIPSNQEISLHNDISRRHFRCSREFVISSEEWLLKLQKYNQISSWLPEPVLSDVLSERWYKICRNAQKLGTWTWKIFWQSTLCDSITLRPKAKIGFGVKCLLRL